jgi:hypothetical protein
VRPGLRAALLGCLSAVGGCAGGNLADEDAAGSMYSGPPTGDASGVVIPTPDALISSRLDARAMEPGDAGPGDARPNGPDGPPAPPTDPPDPVDPNDQDGDGASPPDDCDDTNPARAPGLVETPGDGFDSNCDGQDDLPCVRATDCPPAWYCTNDFVCRPGCRSTDCKDGLQCNSLDRVCVPDDLGLSCGSDADCPADRFCRFFTPPGSEALHTTCELNEGAAPGGTACTEDAECRSGACFLGRSCMGLCRDAADCADGSACAWARIVIGDTENRVHLCLGQLRACERLGDCGAGEVCTLLARPDAPRGFTLACLPAPEVAGAGISGTPCRDDAECRTGICLQDNTCFAPCGDDTDCAPGKRCYDPGIFFIDDGGSDLTADDVLTGLPFCTPDTGSDTPCDALRRCAEGEVCAPSRRADGRTFDTRCTTANGPGVGGAPCERDAECALGACDEGRCAGLCFADADCVGDTRCVEGRYILDTQDTPDPYDDLTADLGFCRP